MSFLHTDHDDVSSGAGTGKYVVLAVVLLLGAGAAGYWFYGRTSDAEPEPEPVAPRAPVAETEAPPPAPETTRREDLPSTGRLSITSNVDGATVYLDGERVGTSPYENAEIDTGSYEVKVTKDGYVDFVERVRIRGGRSADVRASLDPRPPSLRIVSDVPGATVFLDRNYIGTTPVDIEDVAPGEHQLTVSAEGYEMHASTITVSSGHRDVRVSFEKAAAQLNESIRVVHKHGFGSCSGTLVADENGIRYETDDNDAFAVPFDALGRFEVDYIDKNLNLKVRGGRNYNFTEESGDADALFVFHKNVQEFMERM